MSKLPEMPMLAAALKRIDEIADERDALRAELTVHRKATSTALSHIFGVLSEYWDGHYTANAALAAEPKDGAATTEVKAFIEGLESGTAP